MATLKDVGPQTGTKWYAGDEERAVEEKYPLFNKRFSVSDIFKKYWGPGTPIENV